MDTPICFREGVVDLHACTPADAQAALEARDKRIREKALREIERLCHQYKTSQAIRTEILALIEEEQTDD